MKSSSRRPLETPAICFFTGVVRRRKKLVIFINTIFCVRVYILKTKDIIAHIAYKTEWYKRAYVHKYGKKHQIYLVTAA